MMKIIVIIIALITLLLNLNAYKDYFKSAEKREKEFKKALDHFKDDRDVVKGIGVLIGTIITIPVITFYIIAGFVFGKGILLLYSVLMVLLTIIGYFKGLVAIVNEKARKGIMWRIWLPINTVFIVYFLYYYINL